MSSPGLKDGSKPDLSRNQSPDPKSGENPLAANLKSQSLPKAAKGIVEDARITAKIEELREAGFSEEHIAIIQQKVPDLDVEIMEEKDFMASISIHVRNAFRLRNKTGSAVVFKFNDFLVIIPKTDTRTADERIKEINAIMDDPSREKARNQDLTPEEIAVRKQEIVNKYEQLPDFFKEWVKHESNGGVFLFRSNERFFAKIAIDANQLVEELKSVEELERWKKLSLWEREEAVPGLVADHSTSFIHNKVLELAKEYLDTINN